MNIYYNLDMAMKYISMPHIGWAHHPKHLDGRFIIQEASHNAKYQTITLAWINTWQMEICISNLYSQE